MTHKLPVKQFEGFTLVEIVIVVAIIGIIAAVTVVALKPQELFANGRNARRITDIAALNTAMGQWLAREGLQMTDPYSTLGLTAPGVSALTPGDGSITGEGVNASAVTQLTSAGYMQSIPLDPNGVQYRIGVDNVATPAYVLICTDQVENTSSYPEGQYPNGMFCQSN
ncbi:prepilin-type N-terminal cleavage/methylation domain-containing protein [Candidatus Dojkabacteria bacterium]|nr:prepilin-type N-terminal cleavage/methylation domain-containing protein [Candidatus Dojkabacteria bacterium]